MHLIATINLSLNVTSDYKEPIRVIWTTYYGEICYNKLKYTSHIVPGHNFVHEISSVVTGTYWLKCVLHSGTACKWPYIRSTPALYERCGLLIFYPLVHLHNKVTVKWNVYIISAGPKYTNCVVANTISQPSTQDYWQHSTKLFT